MVWIIAVIVVVLIVWWFIKMSSPEGAAKGVARTQLMSFYAFKAKYPNMDKGDLYTAVIKTRPGYDTNEKVEALIDFAMQLNVQKNGAINGYQVTFMWLVVAMCVIEYNQGHKQASGDSITRIWKTVSRMIPEDL